MTPLLEDLRGAVGAQQAEKMQIEGFRPAAVLVPLLNGEAGLELLFTVRSGDLSNHAGQISFPGGRLDAGETVEDAARRETLEEVGLEVPEDRLLGFLDDHPSPARYIVTPVVALLDWPQPLKLNPAEVDAVFTAPLSDLYGLEPYTKTATLKAFSRTLHCYPYGERLIWGLTGNVMKNLLDLIRDARVGISR